MVKRVRSNSDSSAKGLPSALTGKSKESPPAIDDDNDSDDEQRNSGSPENVNSDREESPGNHSPEESPRTPSAASRRASAPVSLPGSKLAAAVKKVVTKTAITKTSLLSTAKSPTAAAKPIPGYLQGTAASAKKAARSGAASKPSASAFARLEEADATVARPVRAPIQPGRDGRRRYYLARVDVAALSVTDLDEVNRWLRGELQPAVRGERNPGTALTRGIRTVATRLLGGERRSYEARNAGFRANF